MTTYEPRGGAREFLLSRDPAVLVSGPAGSGKSVACLMKLHLTSLMVPGCVTLLLRQTHVSLKASVLRTYETFVAAQELANGDVKWYGGSGAKPAAYMYRNGSIIIPGGLDQPQKFLSMDVQRIHIDEANGVSASAVQTVATRLRGNAPTYRQLSMSTNPDSTYHHLYQMAQDGRAKMIYSVHEDNPYLYGRDGKLTEVGADYMARLDSLTGTAYLRYRKGLWVNAEGMVYDDWDESVHVVDRNTPLPDIRRVFNSVDWGFNNALVWQEWGVDSDGRMYLLREISRKGWLVEDFARHCREHLWRDPDNRTVLPEAVVVDHDAEDRATFERHARFPTTPARKAVGRGVQLTQQRLRKDALGLPNLMVVRGCLIGRDPIAEARKTPRGLLSEITGYVWQTERGTDGVPKEAPLKVNDHSMDAMRYAVMYLDDLPPARANNPTQGPRGGAVNPAWGRKLGSGR